MANETAVRKLLNAIQSRQRSVSLEHCTVGSFNSIFDAVVDADPRVIVYIELEKLQYNYSKKSMLSINEDYGVTIEYSSKFSRIEEIVVYDSKKNAESIIDNRIKDEICVVGKDMDSFLGSLNSVYSKYTDTLEGFQQLYWETMSYRDYGIVNLHVQFSAEIMQRQGMLKKTDFEVNRIISEMRNVNRIPIFLKIFLAFSYVQQNCSFNRTAQLEKLEAGQKTKYTNASMAYGVINDHSASSKGIAWMLKHLLDAMNIENIIVRGKIEDTFIKSEDYYWNMVIVDGQFYHIDASWNIDMDGIFVGGFMKDDAFMAYTHMWYDYYPNAKGTRFDYDYVEEYLIDNGEDLLDMGILDYLLFPEPVNDF